MDKKQETQQKADTRHRGWVFTVNNPIQSETELYEYLQGLYNVRYFVFAKEQGDKEETPHYQGYIEFTEPKYFSKMKHDFSEPLIKPAAHIEPRKGTKKQAADYVKKIDEYADKKHTQTGEIHEFGKLPPEERERSDLNDIMDDIEDGLTNIDLAKKYGNKFISVRAWADEYRQDILAQKSKRERRLNIEVTYISGVTDAGKTRRILDEFGDENVYRATDYGGRFSTEKFDGYKGENIIIFEEFRSQIKIEKMLNYLDVYAIELPSRFRNKWACYTKVFIVSNWKLNEQYKNIQSEHPGTWKAFLRRIHKVYDFDVSKDTPIGGKTFAGLKPLTQAEQDELPF